MASLLVPLLLQFSGEIYIPEIGSYTFYLEVDDDARLTINGNLLIDVTCTPQACNGIDKNVTTMMTGPAWYPIE